MNPDDHFNTTPGYPQTRAEVEAASNAALDAFMARCGLEPADFEDCLACYAYKVMQDRDRGTGIPGDPVVRASAERIVRGIYLARDSDDFEATVLAVEQELWSLAQTLGAGGRQ